MRCTLAALLLMFLSATADAAPDRYGHARIVTDRVEIDERIRFEFDSDALDRDSIPVLRDVAQLLRDHPEITRIEVRGHTDSQGSDSYNRALSQERADEVARFLSQNGVSQHRIVARGYGESRPLIQGFSERAHTVNRRVEFIVFR
ncbi:MAG: OOP family OmpA-OmpF porin [Myxococcota bacterium]|jgi:OOP family OmpA-OmpF porin